MKVAFLTLGCKVNSYETDRMRTLFENEGYDIVPFDSPADVYVVNTCTVTGIADRKSRKMLHRAKRLNPGGAVVAAGCYVDSSDRTVLEDEGIICIGNNEKDDIINILKRRSPELFSEYSRNTPSDEYTDDTVSGERAGGILSGSDNKNTGSGESSFVTGPHRIIKADPPGISGHIRADVEIQNGCNQYCTYCIIPFVRGHLKSRSPEDAVDEITSLARAGYREVVITGIHLSSYGITEGITDRNGKKITADTFVGLEGRPLLNLLELADDVEGIDRIRLGSLEPRIITEGFAERLSKIRKFCPHFHLSLQSGCDRTLKSMNRHYDTGDFLKSVDILNRYFDRPNITTDIIVGFPGETEEDFQESADFAVKAGFADIHVFRYSPRPGTVAYKRKDQVSDEEKNERSSRMIEVRDRLRKIYGGMFEGDEADVLFEQIKEENGVRTASGYTENYLMVHAELPPRGIQDERNYINHICRVKLGKFDGKEFTGEIVGISG